jgi:CTP:molybdopterin cytidylyltransferase MocA
MGEFKPLLPLPERFGKGETFIGHIIENFREAGTGEIAIVTGREAQRLEDWVRGSLDAHGGAGAQRLARFVRNADFATTDMFYSAAMGLRELAGCGRMPECDYLFFSTVDAPLWSVETAQALREAAQQDDAPDILVPCYRGEPGHPQLFSAAAARELAAAEVASRGCADRAGLRGAIRDYTGRKAFIDFDDPGIVRDFDTMEEYARYMEPNVCGALRRGPA